MAGTRDGAPPGRTAGRGAEARPRGVGPRDDAPCDVGPCDVGPVAPPARKPHPTGISRSPSLTPAVPRPPSRGLPRAPRAAHGVGHG